MKHNYIPGSWLAVCDRCGFTFHASELYLEWTGLRVCFKDFDVRHPQEFVRGVADKVRPPWVRPEPPPYFLEPNEVSYDDVSTGGVGFDSGFDGGFA